MEQIIIQLNKLMIPVRITVLNKMILIKLKITIILHNRMILIKLKIKTLPKLIIRTLQIQIRIAQTLLILILLSRIIAIHLKRIQLNKMKLILLIRIAHNRTILIQLSRMIQTTTKIIVQLSKTRLIKHKAIILQIQTTQALTILNKIIQTKLKILTIRSKITILLKMRQVKKIIQKLIRHSKTILMTL